MLRWLRTRKADSLYERGRTLIETGNPRDAIPLGEALIGMKHSGGFEVLALAHEACGDLKQAVAAAERGVRTAPGVWLLWQLLGNLLDADGRPEEGLSAYEKAAACPGAVTSALEYNRALALAHLSRHEEAFHGVERALRSSPPEDLQLLLVALGIDSLLATGRASEAVRFAQLAVDSTDAKDASRPALLAELAWATWKFDGDKAAARERLDTIIDLGGRGDRWLQLMRELDARPVAQGSTFKLLLRGRAEVTAKNGTTLGFYVGMRVIAGDEEDAVGLARRILPKAVRDSVSAQEVQRLSAAAPGTLAGVSWYPGGRSFFPEEK